MVYFIPSHKKGGSKLASVLLTLAIFLCANFGGSLPILAVFLESRMFLELNGSDFCRRFSQYGTLDDLTLCDFFTSLLHDHFFVGLVRSVESVPSWHYCVRVQ